MLTASKKTERMHLALSVSERKAIEARADELHLSVSELLRMGALSYTDNSQIINAGATKAKPPITGSQAHSMRLKADFKLDYDQCSYYLFIEQNLICTSPIGQTSGVLYPTFDLAHNPIITTEDFTFEWIIYRRAIFPYIQKGLILNKYQVQNFERLAPVLEKSNHMDNRFGNCSIYKLKRHDVQLIFLTFMDDVRGGKAGYVHQILFL